MIYELVKIIVPRVDLGNTSIILIDGQENRKISFKYY